MDWKWDLCFRLILKVYFELPREEKWKGKGNDADSALIMPKQGGPQLHLDRSSWGAQIEKQKAKEQRLRCSWGLASFCSSVAPSCEVSFLWFYNWSSYAPGVCVSVAWLPPSQQRILWNEEQWNDWFSEHLWNTCTWNRAENKIIL